MKYLKAKKTTRIYDVSGSVKDTIDVSLHIVSEERVMDQELVYINHIYKETGTSGKTEDSFIKQKSITYAEAAGLMQALKPIIPEGLNSEEVRDFALLTAAKQFFADKYKDLEISDIEIIE